MRINLRAKRRPTDGQLKRCGDFRRLQKNFSQLRADELITDQRQENIKLSKLYFRTRGEDLKSNPEGCIRQGVICRTKVFFAKSIQLILFSSKLQSHKNLFLARNENIKMGL